MKRLTVEKKWTASAVKCGCRFFTYPTCLKAGKMFRVWISRAEVEDNCSEKIKRCGKRMKKLWKIKK